MEAENDKHTIKDFSRFYVSEHSNKSDSDYNESSHERSKKETLKNKKKDKSKDKGYAALDPESSADEKDGESKCSLKKRPKSFKFLHKREKDVPEEERKKDREERKKEKLEKKIKEKEEKKIKKDKKKKTQDFPHNEEELKIFGLPLCIAVDRNPSHDGIKIPAVVRECIDFIEESGLNCDGIYRINGSKNKVQSLIKSYNIGENVQFDEQHPCTIASLLKQFLKELPETLLTVDMMPHFEDASLVPNPRQRAEAMGQLIDRLPTSNKLLLQYVLKHMVNMVEKEKETGMTFHNACVILSPIMQISHRVLNVMFHSHHFLLRNVHIQRYVPPLTGQEQNGRALESLKTNTEIEEEMKRQESLLNFLHSSIANGKSTQFMEERLWATQRIVTLLKRKLKKLDKRPHDRENELSSEESTKDFNSPNVSERFLDRLKPICSEEGGSETDSMDTASSKSPSKENSKIYNVEDNSKNTSKEKQSTKKLSENASKSVEKKVFDEKSNAERNTQASNFIETAKTTIDMPKKESISGSRREKDVDFIPILPKPLSRNDRSRFPVREKGNMDIAKNFKSRNSTENFNVDKVKSLSTTTSENFTNISAPEAVGVHKIVDIKTLSKKESNFAKFDHSSDFKIKSNDLKAIAPAFQTNDQTKTCINEFENNFVPTANVNPYNFANKTSNTVHSNNFQDNFAARTNNFDEALKPHTIEALSKLESSNFEKFNEEDHHFNWAYYNPNTELVEILTEKSDIDVLCLEETRLRLENEQLNNLNLHLSNKVQLEKTEIGRIREEIAELQSLYGYRIHSYDSSETDSVFSEGGTSSEGEIQVSQCHTDKETWHPEGLEESRKWSQYLEKSKNWIQDLEEDKKGSLDLGEGKNMACVEGSELDYRVVEPSSKRLSFENNFDTEEDALSKIFNLEKNCKEISFENEKLLEKINIERSAVVRLKVAIKQLSLKSENNI